MAKKSAKATKKPGGASRTRAKSTPQKKSAQKRWRPNEKPALYIFEVDGKLVLDPLTQVRGRGAFPILNMTADVVHVELRSGATTISEDVAPGPVPDTRVNLMPAEIARYLVIASRVGALATYAASGSRGGDPVVIVDPGV